MDRAYAQLVVKGLEALADRTIVTGIASTPTPDVENHSVDPAGVTFQNPIPLLLYHDKTAPVGKVWLAREGNAITFRAELPHILAAGVVKDRVDEAITSIKAGLLPFVSIGFLPLKDGIKRLAGGLLQLAKTRIYELSLVTIPANSDATILTVKALDAPHLAAAGRNRPGVPGLFISKTMTNAEAITQWENKRAATAGAMSALMTKANDAGVALEGEDATKYDELGAEVTTIDEQLDRLRTLEKLNVKTAAPIVPPTPPAIVTFKPDLLEKGTGFVRYFKALAISRGNIMQAAEYANRWNDSTPAVALALKAAVTAGTTTDATWAGPLAPLKPLANEFLEYLRPATLLGKIPGLFQVPFNCSVPIQTGGGTYKWVGQGAAKPVGKLAFGTVTLTITKCAGIIVITDELARNSSPPAESVIRREMVNGIAYFLDQEFTDPAKAPVANVSPGSITNGVTPITTAGTSAANARTDFQALINAMTAAGISTAGAVLLISETNAAALSSALNPLGQPLFGDLTVAGGNVLGIKAIASQAVGNNVILLQPNAIMYADDGGVTIDVSTEASVQMDDAPAPADATTVFTSFWQNNLVGLRAERYINWKRARTGAVQYTVATYTV